MKWRSIGEGLKEGDFRIVFLPSSYPDGPYVYKFYVVPGQDWYAYRSVPVKITAKNN